MSKHIWSWRDVPPFAVFGIGFAVYEQIAHGYQVAWTTVALWCVAFAFEHVMHKATERDADEWKDLALTTQKVTLLLTYAAGGGDLTVTKAPDGMTIDECQRRVDEIVKAVRNVG